MTLIARTLNHFAPTMIADILFTQENVTHSIILPTIGIDITKMLPANKPKPVFLAQKLYVLNDKLCIAFAGVADEIISLLEDFRPFCSAPGLNTESLLKFLRQYDFSSFRESAFFMMLIENDADGKLAVQEFSYGDFSSHDNRLFDQSQTIGTGTKDFESITNEVMNFFSSFQDGDIRQGIVKKASLIARLLTEERYTLASLFNQWGGGYEFAFFDGKKIMKLDNTAYILQTGDSIDGEPSIQLPIMAQLYRYNNQELIITSVEMHNLELGREGEYITMTSNILKVRQYLIPELRRGVFDFEHQVSKVTSFDSNSVAMGFLLQTSNTILKPSFYSYSIDIRVTFSPDKQLLVIYVHERLRDFIANKLKKEYQDEVNTK
ncbi:MAG: hypothetical protein JST87_16540 [Bacteroidetes bacterium]|nr:hypothetical protein [Bacteroidota bacterium]